MIFGKKNPFAIPLFAKFTLPVSLVFGLKKRDVILKVCLVSRISGGFRGGAGARAPPGHPNSFNFMQFSGKFGKIVCWRPPWGVGAPPRGNPGSAAENKHVSEEISTALSETVKVRIEKLYLGLLSVSTC